MRVRVVHSKARKLNISAADNQDWSWVKEHKVQSTEGLTASQKRAYNIYCQAATLLKATFERPNLFEEADDLPAELDNGEVSDEVQALAYRILRDNEEEPEEEADILPGSATDDTVDVDSSEGSDEAMQILADPPEGEEPVKESKTLPRTMPKNRDAKDIHVKADTNLQILSNIFNHM